jgi:hypothetical protein
MNSTAHGKPAAVWLLGAVEAQASNDEAQLFGEVECPQASDAAGNR